MSLPGFKFSSPELSSLAISQREWREVAGSYGRNRQGIFNINNDLMDGGFISFIRPVKEPRENTFGRAKEENENVEFVGTSFFFLLIISKE